MNSRTVLTFCTLHRVPSHSFATYRPSKDSFEFAFVQKFFLNEKPLACLLLFSLLCVVMLSSIECIEIFSFFNHHRLAVLKLYGGPIPHRDLAFPHEDLGVPLLRFECWMIRRKRPNSSPNFGEKPLQFPAKTFFFGVHLIFAKKHFNFRQRLPFLVFIQFRRRNYAIFTKVLSHAKSVRSRLQKPPPMQNFTISVRPTSTRSPAYSISFTVPSLMSLITSSITNAN